MLGGYVPDEIEEDIKSSCKTLTQKIRINCTVSQKTKPYSFVEKYVIGFRGRFPTHTEEMIIAGKTVNELELIKAGIISDFEELHKDWTVEVYEI